MTEGLPIATSINSVDIGIVTVMILSCIFGALRGFTREVLSIGAWGGAGSLTFFLFPFARCYARDLIGQPLLSDGVTIGLLFLSSLIAFSLIIRNISGMVKKSMLGGLDRSFGLLFGFARGGAVLILLFFMSGLLWKKPENRPCAFQTSRLVPMVAQGALFASRFISDYYLTPEYVKNLTQQCDYNPEELMFRLANPRPTDINSGKDKVSGYGNGQRQDMNRLFQNYAD